jgi:hypothetical protein
MDKPREVSPEGEGSAWSDEAAQNSPAPSDDDDTKEEGGAPKRHPRQLTAARALEVTT